MAEVIGHWMASMAKGDRPANVRDLFEHLVTEHDYGGSYKSVLRYVRTHFERPRCGPIVARRRWPAPRARRTGASSPACESAARSATCTPL
jgi:hypothetical protein